MPNPKDPVKLQAYREKQRAIALSRGYGKWMRGKSPTQEVKDKLSATMTTQRNTVEWSKRLTEQAKKAGSGKWMKGRAIYPSALLYARSRKGKNYKEIYGDRAEEEAQKRTISNRANWPIGSRQADIRPQHNASFEYVEWRTAVFQRDNYICLGCGAGQYLHAHHIWPWAKYPEKRFDVNNGATLCKECHKLVHSKD